MTIQPEKPDFEKIQKVFDKANFFNEQLQRYLFRDAKVITLYSLMSKRDKKSLCFKSIPFAYGSSIEDVMSFWDDLKNKMKQQEMNNKYTSIEKNVIKHYALEEHKTNIMFFINFFCFQYFDEKNDMIKENKKILVTQKKILYELITSLKWLCANNKNPLLTFNSNDKSDGTAKISSPPLFSKIKNKLLEEFAIIDWFFFDENKTQNEKLKKFKKKHEEEEYQNQYFKTLTIEEWEEYFLSVFDEYLEISKKNQERYHSEIKFFMDIMQIYLEEFTDYVTADETKMSNEQAKIIGQILIKLDIFGDFKDLSNHVKHTLKNFREKKKKLLS